MSLELYRTEYKKIDGFENMLSIQEDIVTQMIQKHEDLLKEILRQILKREPVLEDAKDLCRITMDGVIDKYDLAYKGHKIGVVTIDSDYKNGKVGYTFYPYK